MVNEPKHLEGRRRLFLIKHADSNRFFVGSTSVDYNERQYLSSISSASNTRIAKAIREYGRDSFESIYLDEVPEEEAKDKINFFINTYNTREPVGFNAPLKEVAVVNKGRRSRKFSVRQGRACLDRKTGKAYRSVIEAEIYTGYDNRTIRKYCNLERTPRPDYKYDWCWLDEYMEYCNKSGYMAKYRFVSEE